MGLSERSRGCLSDEQDAVQDLRMRRCERRSIRAADEGPKVVSELRALLQEAREELLPSCQLVRPSARRRRPSCAWVAEGKSIGVDGDS